MPPLRCSNVAGGTIGPRTDDNVGRRSEDGPGTGFRTLQRRFFHGMTVDEKKQRDIIDVSKRAIRTQGEERPPDDFRKGPVSEKRRGELDYDL